ncbi:MAG: L-histidine N(alpha)-methyltransferase [Candidatus Binatia bacterium]
MSTERLSMETGNANNGRLRISTPVEIHSQFREDVTAGLQGVQKAIPPKYFYDARGSLLFEQICQQPEYYLTRTEMVILQAHVADVFEEVGECAVVELGSGSSLKTRLFLDECQRRFATQHYVPIDISASMLESAATELIRDYPALSVDALATDYFHGLDALPGGQTRLVLFLGSNLGNFAPAEQERLFQKVAVSLQTGDYFVVGLDLRKAVTVLESAYNDAAGVTAAFNLNLLRRINRELSGQFDLSAFSHLAFYNSARHQIEMHLQSTKEQEVIVSDVAVRAHFRAGETIHTEISRKFDAAEISAQLTNYGFQQCAQWTDERGWFLVGLFRFVSAGFHS